MHNTSLINIPFITAAVEEWNEQKIALQHQLPGSIISSIEQHLIWILVEKVLTLTAITASLMYLLS